MSKIKGKLTILGLFVYVWARGNHEWQWLPDMLAACALAAVMYRNYRSRVMKA